MLKLSTSEADNVWAMIIVTPWQESYLYEIQKKTLGHFLRDLIIICSLYVCACLQSMSLWFGFVWFDLGFFIKRCYIRRFMCRVLQVLKTRYIYYEFSTHFGNTFNLSKGLHRGNEQSLANRAAPNICIEPSVCTSWIYTHRAHRNILKSLSDLEWAWEANPNWSLPHWSSFNFPRACSTGAAQSDTVEFTQPHSEDPSVAGEDWGPHFTNTLRGTVWKLWLIYRGIKRKKKKPKQTGQINYLLHIVHSTSLGSKKIHSKVWKCYAVPALVYFHGFQPFFFSFFPLIGRPSGISIESGTP